MRPLLALGVALGLGACAVTAPQEVGRYRLISYDVRLPLGFVPDRAELAAADRQALEALGRDLPQTVVPDVYAAGALAPARIAAIDAALRRPTRWILDSLADPARVVLVVQAPEQVVADACRGPGVRLPGNIWPGSENSAPIIMPPGCAVATAIAAQASDPADLLVGRPLPPGAALPYAAAIERYYHRNDQAAAATATAAAPAATADGGSAAPLAAQNPQNPLLGPLPVKEPGGPAAP